MSQTETVQLELRKIGNVQVFDLSGVLTGAELDPIIQKIEQAIHKKKLRRVIMNLQKVQSMDEIALRKVTAVLLRPQRSLIFIPDGECRNLFNNTHLPGNVKLCKDEEEVAEAFGSFLFVKDKAYEVAIDENQPQPANHGLERRRDKRIRVAIPIKIMCTGKDGDQISSKAIATNVSRGGLFAEFLDLNAPEYSKMEGMQGAQIFVDVPANDTFKEEMRMQGKILRFELLKKQYGIAIQFV
jgi:anti-anti-sigma regulatory factor